MSADCAAASALTRALTAARSACTAWADARAARSPSTTPSSPDSAVAVTTSAVAISVLDGTQSVRTHEPPMPSRSTSDDLAAELGGDQRRLVAARPASDDHRCASRPHSWRTGVRSAAAAMALYAAYGSNLDPHQMADRAPHSPPRGHRLAGRLAAELRRRGPRLGGLDRDPGRVPVGPGLRDALRPHRPGRGGPRPWEGADLGLYRKLRVRVQTMEGVAAGLGLRARRVRGRAALGALPRRSSPTPRRSPARPPTTWPTSGRGLADPSGP